MNSLDRQYQALLQDILDNGTEKTTRNGKTLSVFGRQIRHRMQEGYPLLTTKKMAFKSIITELIWFVMGGTNIKFLVDNDCHIWDGDAYQAYLKWFNSQSQLFTQAGIFREPWTKEQYIEQVKLGNVDTDLSDLGPIYGKQWRNWPGRVWTPRAWLDEKGNMVVRHNNNIKVEFERIDQIENLINELKNNPDSRRMMVSAWNVGELDQMVLPPCHYGFQVWTRELSDEEKWKHYSKSGLNIEVNGTPLELKHMGTPFYPKSLPHRAISLMWNQRSVDTFLGLPFNIASYGALLMMLADELQMVPDELIGNLGDTHLYLNHIEQAKEQISREPFPLPTLKVEDGMYCRHVENFYLENYQSHPAIKAPLSN